MLCLCAMHAELPSRQIVQMCIVDCVLTIVSYMLSTPRLGALTKLAEDLFKQKHFGLHSPPQIGSSNLIDGWPTYVVILGILLDGNKVTHLVLPYERTILAS